MPVATVNNKISRTATPSTCPDLAFQSAVKNRRARSVYLKEFGDYLAGLRPADWSQSDAARYAKQRSIKGLTRNMLVRLDKGENRHVEPGILRAVAELYGVDANEVIDTYLAMRGYRSDLPRQSRATRSDLSIQGGSADVPASERSARLQELAILKATVAKYEARLNQVRDVARTLAKLAAVRRQGRKASRQSA